MPSYVVTGAGKGLGYEFIRQFSAIPDAQVFGLVRDVPAAEQKVKEAGLENVHILQGDITDRDALKAAAAKVAETVPGVDYLINNAAYLDANTAFTALSDFDGKEDVLDYALNQTFQVNVVGVINTINAFLPLVRKSAVKKVITISSGMGDEVEAAKYSLFEGAPYSISKAAVNMVTAKYSAKHADEGILFLSLAPGMIATNNEAAPPPDSDLPRKFMKAYPHFTGPTTAKESISLMREVIERASATNEFAGAFVSQFGNKQWL